jgi:hypothetical protein
MPNGYVIYRGPSKLDGTPIVAIAITESHNSKTGNMVQSYILRDDVEPHIAIKDGRDAAICGNCKHRPFLGGACYVVTYQGPLVVYRNFKAGKYPDLAPAAVSALIAGRMVRLGAYGDPAAVPKGIWNDLLRQASGHTGFTHQWGAKGRVLKDICMASVDTPEERETAARAGWRTMRIRTADEPVGEREFVCPASKEAGYRKHCVTCGACDGAARGANKGSVVIIAHGSLRKRYERMREAA